LSKEPLGAVRFATPIRRVGRFLLRNFLTAGILVGAVAAVACPHPGIYLHEAKILPRVIFAVFICSGLSLQTAELLRRARDLKALLYAVLAVSAVFPLLGYVTGKTFMLPPGSFVGLMVVTSSPPALASGIILSTLAGGSVPMAILITIGCSTTAVLLMPTVLEILLGLGMRIDLPVAEMMWDLGLVVILPTVIGQLIRWPLVDRIRRWRPTIALVQSSLVILMIFTAVSKGAGQLRAHGLPLVVHVAAVVVSVHCIMLAINHTAGRTMRLSGPALRSLTIVASQKTLPLSAYVAMTYFPAYPTAVISCVLFHLLQLMVDSLLANHWAGREHAAEFQLTQRNGV
jgi:sodium/bile acid cotransporter 7